MKKIIMLFAMCVLCLTGCSEQATTETLLSSIYDVGEEVELGGVKFNIYKIDDKHNELYLLAKESIASTVFYDDEHKGSNVHSYEGSLIEDYINEFVDKIENKGVNIVDSGLIDEEDLYELGFRHSDGLSGLPYYYNGTQDYISYEENFWVGGYCKYQTRSWVYSNGTLDTQPCDSEYNIRPIIIISSSEIEK